MSNPFKNVLNWLSKNFSNDTSRVIITASIVGWIISAVAQATAVAFNPKLDKEQKSFLLPQEFADVAVNIAAFFLVTQSAKKYMTKMFKTGKFAPKTVREHLNKNKSLYGDKVGKLDLNLDEALMFDKFFPDKEYKTCKNLMTTLATVTGGIISTNLITPVISNNMAAKMQKKYIANSQALAKDEAVSVNNKENNQNVELKKPLSTQTFRSGSLKI